MEREGGRGGSEHAPRKRMTGQGRARKLRGQCEEECDRGAYSADTGTVRPERRSSGFGLDWIEGMK